MTLGCKYYPLMLFPAYKAVCLESLTQVWKQTLAPLCSCDTEAKSLPRAAMPTQVLAMNQRHCPVVFSQQSLLSLIFSSFPCALCLQQLLNDPWKGSEEPGLLPAFFRILPVSWVLRLCLNLHYFLGLLVPMSCQDLAVMGMKLSLHPLMDLGHLFVSAYYKIFFPRSCWKAYICPEDPELGLLKCAAGKGP